MDGRQFTITLFRDAPPPRALRLEESISVYPAVLVPSGKLRCMGFSVGGLAEIETLCILMLEAGLPDGAMQVRTPMGEAVCFVASLQDLVRQPNAPEADPQLELLV
ncbi:hypothetical protein [Acidisoma sp. 7E03]